MTAYELEWHRVPPCIVEANAGSVRFDFESYVVSPNNLLYNGRPKDWIAGNSIYNFVHYFGGR